jgi:hypothetical protein
MPERAGIDEQLREVRDGLEQIEEKLETLSSAIWQDIDHEHRDRLEQGVRFKQRFNERRASLMESIEQMVALLREYPRSDPGSGITQLAEDVAQPQEEVAAAPSAPAVGEPGTTSPVAAGLDQKVPFGFVLGGRTFTSASAWPLFYEALLQELYGRSPEKVSGLADAPGGFKLAGRALFARAPDLLDDPLPIADAIFAEADLSPESLIQVIKELMGHMGFPLDSFKILLKEKNRGTVETLSLAA